MFRYCHGCADSGVTGVEMLQHLTCMPPGRAT
jgi:hypothetical protein